MAFDLLEVGRLPFQMCIAIFRNLTTKALWGLLVVIAAPLTSRVSLASATLDVGVRISKAGLSVPCTAPGECWSSDNPEVNLDFCQISIYYGYSCTNYWNQVQTEDGYLLTIHRVYQGNVTSRFRDAVYLQHGLLTDSISWVMLKQDSLPFLLADAGYDVWVGNSRGNTFSRKHISLKPYQEEFWEWSWDEIGRYDLPAFIDFVLNVTKRESIFYIGHSQGTLLAFTHMTSPRYTKQIKHMIALGPVFNVSNMISPLRYIAPISEDLKELFDDLHVYDFFPRTKLVKWIGEYMCEAGHLPKALCSDILFLLAGFDKAQLNQDRLDVIFSHEPAGTSVQNMFHYAQMVEGKQCAGYDYGSVQKNMQHYNSDVPPVYDIRKLAVNVTLYYSENDWLADQQDVQYIIRNCPRVVGRTFIPKWNHLDFLWAEDARTVLYDSLVKLLLQL